MRVLLVKMSSLGDVVHALPAVTDAVAHGVSIDWVVEEAFADVARLHRGVNEVIPIALRRWRSSPLTSRVEIGAFTKMLRGRQYDLILDSQGLYKSAVVALLAGGRRAGFAKRSAREPLSTVVNQLKIEVPRTQHAIDRQRQLFASALGYEISRDCDSGLAKTPTVAGRVFLLHGTTWPTKHWPESMWVDLAGKVTAAGAHPLVTWGSDVERERAEHIARASGATIVPRGPLRELVDMIAASEIVIGVDSGLTHLSAALGVPTVGIYGPTDIGLTGCRGPRSRVIDAIVPCAPCLSPLCKAFKGDPLEWNGSVVEPPCFASITPERVWSEACRLKVAAA